MLCDIFANPPSPLNCRVLFEWPLRCKPDGLDSQDQSQSKSWFFDLSKWINKTCQIFSTVDTNFFFVPVKIFKIKTFQSSLCHVEIFVEIVKLVETNSDCQNLSRQIKICQDILTLWRHFEYENDEKSWEIEKSRQDICKNPLTSWSRSRWTVEKWQNFQVPTNFSILIETFGSRHWCRDKIKKSQSWSRFLGCQDELFDNVEIESLNQDMVETNREPQA